MLTGNIVEVHVLLSRLRTITVKRNTDLLLVVEGIADVGEKRIWEQWDKLARRKRPQDLLGPEGPDGVGQDPRYGTQAILVQVKRVFVENRISNVEGWPKDARTSLEGHCGVVQVDVVKDRPILVVLFVK